MTQQRHWLCTAAMVFMPVSTPIKVSLSAQSGHYSTLARNASVANDPKRKSRPQANSFSLLNTPNDDRIRVGRGPARHINYRGSS